MLIHVTIWCYTLDFNYSKTSVVVLWFSLQFPLWYTILIIFSCEYHLYTLFGKVLLLSSFPLFIRLDSKSLIQAHRSCELSHFEKTQILNICACKHIVEVAHLLYIVRVMLLCAGCTVLQSSVCVFRYLCSTLCILSKVCKTHLVRFINEFNLWTFFWNRISVDDLYFLIIDL